LLASNIANADTPNYKARDVDFGSALNNAVNNRGSGGLTLANTSPKHLKGSASDAMDETIQPTPSRQPSADGNTVDMDVERSKFADNAVRIDANLTFIQNMFKTLQHAVQGQ